MFERLNAPPQVLKIYRDLKGVIDTSFEEGKIKRNIEIAREMKKSGEPFDTISKYTGLAKKGEFC